MNFELSEEHLMIRQAARDFAQNELKEGVIERDSKCEYPEKQVKRTVSYTHLTLPTILLE